MYILGITYINIFSDLDLKYFFYTPEVVATILARV